ncbi:protocadherin beta-16 isoform X1 [Octopus bimaculoides]|uniref:protocadherin beta-16 isoform X1 n=1 Tax=Octopus bimaculoides TaxID=37653 RepID=UPI00071C3CAD|nr:protocadherin beta-16 isoform X1 [Octopus bimaculoides]|eukprot:XP_014779592.1 PREDICTED: protocadherin beta-16-like isoform X1 [Octopus bimaculoides]
MCTSSAGTMLALVSLLLSSLDISFAIDITFRVQEEKNIGTYVGDVAAESHFLDGMLSQHTNLITFNQLQQKQAGVSQLFNVSKRGELYTTQRLDAESLCKYNVECFKTIKIAVHKGEAFLKILKIKVIIEDVNDHKPKFAVKSVMLKFSERDGIGLKMAIPNAVDKDVGNLNSKISYQLTRRFRETFKLSVKKIITGSSKLAIILNEKLDREEKDSYSLQIIASDGGSPPKQGVLNIEITVTDENDNAPVFTQNIYNVSIRSTHGRFLPITVLSASDLDLGENGKVTYHISSATSDIAKSYFKLNEVTGEIFTQKTLNSEQKQTYKLFVEAKDGGNPSSSSTAMVLINVINQQNNVPKIDINFVTELRENTAAISEGIKVGSFIAYVSVIDNDVGQNGEVECSLHHDKFLLLDLGSKEYKITLKKFVDRETRDHYDISISCEDKGSPSMKTERKFFIQVMDVNDVQPQFMKEVFKFLTYENGKTNFPIGYINATDPDQDLSGQLSYHLLSNNKVTLPFRITSYGFISTTSSLDREKQEQYKFQVFVKDNGIPPLNNTANVVVEVLDKNDNAPYFTFPGVNPFTLDVHYHPQSKNEIAVLRASDRDSHLNAFLRYSILSGNDKLLFEINPYTGVFAFSRTVYQNDAGSYQLEFAVKDSGTPVLSATTTVSLTLTVSNKTSPALSTVQLKSDKMINLTWVIVIVTSAVIVSVAIVVSITLCVVRCNNNRNNQYITEINSDREKSHYTCVTKKSDTLNRSSNDMMARNTQLIETKAEFYPQYESQSEWTTSTIDKRPQSVLLRGRAAPMACGGPSGVKV